MKIAVVGSGSWGTALAVVLCERHDVVLWSWQQDEFERLDKNGQNIDFLPGIDFPKNLSCTCDMQDVCGADLIVIATPSHAVRTTAENLRRYLRPEQVIVIVSKGLEQNTLMCLSAVVQEQTGHKNIAVLSGPSHAEEVAKKLPATNVAAADDIKISEFVQDAFMLPAFRIYTSTDVIGVQLGGAVKNVIALCAGIIDGLHFGDNAKAALMTRGIKEISRLGMKMGGQFETFSGLAGIGDLIVTCTSMHSRNRRAGILIGEGYSVEQALKSVRMVVEGVRTTDAAYQLSLRHNVSMPIVTEAYNVLFNRKEPAQAVSDLMNREKKHEPEMKM